jgi:cytochrome c556
LLAAAACSLAASAIFTPAELDAHRQWMDDAQDRKDDVREALAARDRAKLVAGAKSLDALTAKESAFWARTALQQAKALASKNRAESQELLRLATAGKFAEGEKAFAQLEKTCTACHDLHFEKHPSLAAARQ